MNLLDRYCPRTAFASDVEFQRDFAIQIPAPIALPHLPILLPRFRAPFSYSVVRQRASHAGPPASTARAQRAV